MEKLENKRKFMQEENEDDLMILNDYQKIMESGKKLHYLSYLERYFTKYYSLDVRHAFNDHLVLLHSNKVAVCALAASHPVLNQSKYRVTRVEFIQGVNEEMRGKHKHFANNVNVNQPICKIFCELVEAAEGEEKTVTFTVYSCLNAKLIETNERLLSSPQLVQTKPDTEGYIAILIPKLDNLKEQTGFFKSHAEFMKIRMDGKSE
jgi:hypothetical protein